MAEQEKDIKDGGQLTDAQMDEMGIEASESLGADAPDVAPVEEVAADGDR